MSLYPQNQYYGQYPATGYAQQMHYQHVAPPPAPVFHLDPISFRRLYTAKLSELTVNSRPIIQSLSMLAQEYSRYSQIVAECLEGHIRRALPWMKLPAFYLFDAISKNLFEPYARIFSAFVVPLFLDTYNDVDQPTRSKMEEMLLTWRTGGPGGKELFGVIPQVAIERGVWGGGPSTVRSVLKNKDDIVYSFPQSSNSSRSVSGHIQKAQVLSELEFTLNQKERAVQANPYDTASQNHINVLHQLRKLVEAGVSQDELQQIVNQLRTFSRSTAPPPPPAPVVQPPIPPAYVAPPPAPAPQFQPFYSNLNIPNQIPPVTVQPQPAVQPTFPAILADIKPATGPSIIPSSSSSNPAASTMGDITSLFNALKKAGIMSSNNTPVGAGETAKEETPKVEVEEGRDASRAYRSMILSQDVKLTSSDIVRRKPAVLSLLYDALPVQCKQCGIRFAETPVGKKKLEDHLDMHFRQNRKANQNIGRGHSRSWFVTAEDWTNDAPSDLKGKGRADGSGRLNAKAAMAAEVAKREAELRSQFVVVPSSEGAKEISCPICKEILHPEFLDDEEEWVWRNAVIKDGKVFHATCLAEATASTTNLAARLRNEVVSRSRSGTPEVNSLRNTPPKSLKAGMRDSMSPSPNSKLAGTKRKAEPDSSLSPLEADGTPPLKKLALAA